jgi:cation:H+ antiporter
MATFFALMFCAAGLVMMIFGSRAVVTSSVQLAEKFGLSQFFIGVVLIGFGTSSPELVASIMSAWSGAQGLSYGNVTGSNIANIGLVLGSTAMLYGLTASEKVIKDSIVLVSLMLGYVLSTYVFSFSHWVGLLYLGVLIGYVWQLRNADKPASPGVEESASVDDRQSWQKRIDQLVGLNPRAAPAVGLALLVLGGYVLVEAATTLARAMSWSESFIGISIVSIGTSLPELLAARESGKRNAPDLVFGNIVGSNIYNVFGVLGITGLIAPTVAPASILYFHNPIMLLTTAGLVYVLSTYKGISKRHGMYMLGGYALYLLLSLMFF